MGARSGSIKELSHKALRETGPTRCAETNPIIKGCRPSEAPILSSLPLSQSQQPTGNGSI